MKKLDFVFKSQTGRIGMLKGKNTNEYIENIYLEKNYNLEPHS